MLNEFCLIRSRMEEPLFDRKQRWIHGRCKVSNDILGALEGLQEADHIQSLTLEGKSISYLPDVVDRTLTFALSVGSLEYFEDVVDLAIYTIQEPDSYYVFSLGDLLTPEKPPPTDEIR